MAYIKQDLNVGFRLSACLASLDETDFCIPAVKQVWYCGKTVDVIKFRLTMRQLAKKIITLVDNKKVKYRHNSNAALLI